uniref:Uncharacterized protein n=1 Tax=Timema tahoe TaxID=61484 RepID=A0A7R9IJ96_9NEOP|nr:unnamed protein product [Timema tahoe]
MHRHSSLEKTENRQSFCTPATPTWPGREKDARASNDPGSAPVKHTPRPAPGEGVRRASCRRPKLRLPCTLVPRRKLLEVPHQNSAAIYISLDTASVSSHIRTVISTSPLTQLLFPATSEQCCYLHRHSFCFQPHQNSAIYLSLDTASVSSQIRTVLLSTSPLTQLLFPATSEQRTKGGEVVRTPALASRRHAAGGGTLVGRRATAPCNVTRQLLQCHKTAPCKSLDSSMQCHKTALAMSQDSSCNVTRQLLQCHKNSPVQVTRQLRVMSQDSSV